MNLPFHIIEMLKRKSGNDLRSASSCEYLALDIESKTGSRIGATTLKRLLGFVDDDRKAYRSTLDIIAAYLGFRDWPSLSAVDDAGNSGFDSIVREVRSDSLAVGEFVRVAYLPDRNVLFRHLGAGRYRVVESRNSKLQPLDEVCVQSFVLGYPLLVSHVWRNGHDLGPFTAGGVGGITELSES